MDVQTIKEFCTSVKHRKQTKIQDLLKDYFGKTKESDLLSAFSKFGENFPAYRKLLTSVVKSIKPDVLCVYILKQGGDVVYVGKSSDVCVRLNTHAKDKDFNEVYIIEAKDTTTQDFCENSLILKYRPKYNKNVNLKQTNVVINFEVDCVSFYQWLNHATWFSGISSKLQEKLNCKFILRGFHSFVNDDYSISFKTGNSIVIQDVPKGVITEPKPNRDIKQRLKQAATDSGKPELFRDVTNSTYKFGKFYITDKGKWRIEGSTIWYKNVDIDRVIKETFEEFNTVSISGHLECVPIWFGKYKGKMYSEVALTDPEYCIWVKAKFKQSELMRLGAI